VVLSIVLAQGGAQIALRSMRSKTPCPEYPRSLHPNAVQFTPGLVQHLSWVEFAVPSSYSGYFVLCLDGTLVQHGGGDLNFAAGIAQLHVSTAWVDLLWFRGQLDGYRDPLRWELKLA
jgi:hypothetical protein